MQLPCSCLFSQIAAAMSGTFLTRFASAMP
jgi:hypothetical protein